MLLILKNLVVGLANAYSWAIFFYVLMSWLPTSTGILRDINNVLAKICDPYLNLFKKLIPPIGGMLDITPIIALVVLQFVVRLIVSIL